MSSRYKLRGEFGDAFFEGTLREVKMVKKAMVDYGVLERKLHVVYPEHHGFKLSAGLQQKVFDKLYDDRVECNPYSDYVVNELNEMSDYDLIEEVQHYIDDDHELSIAVRKEFSDYQAEKALLEEE